MFFGEGQQETKRVYNLEDSGIEERPLYVLHASLNIMKVYRSFMQVQLKARQPLYQHWSLQTTGARTENLHVTQRVCVC